MREVYNVAATGCGVSEEEIVALVERVKEDARRQEAEKRALA
jgi:hypothetical protein